MVEAAQGGTARGAPVAGVKAQYFKALWDGAHKGCGEPKNNERRAYDETTAHFFFTPARPLNPGDPPVLAQKTMCYVTAIHLCRTTAFHDTPSVTTCHWTHMASRSW